MADEAPPAYRGDEPYAFVCYAHSDSAAVYPLLTALSERGIHTWYDEGISPGASWTDELANAIAGCHRVLFIISPASITSGYCLDEINYALENQIDVVCVYLEETQLPPGLKLSLNRRQAVMKHKLGDAAFDEKLAQLATPGSDVAAYVISADAQGQGNGRRLLAAAISAFVVVSIAVVLMILKPWEASEPSLLVLPFDGLGLDEDHAYLPDAINNDLISRLAQTPDFKVIASVSARNLKQSGASEAEMAEQADVEHLLLGSIQSTGNILRVNARLIRADDSSIVWSNQYEGGLDNLFEIQASITSNIARALELRFDQALLARMQDSGTENIEAFDLLLRIQKMLQANDWSKTGDMIEMARQIVELDPEYVDGWVTLGSLEHILNGIIGRQETNAEEYIDKALSLDPESAPAMRMKGLILAFKEPERALSYANKAVERMPQNAIAHTDRAIILTRLNRTDEAYTTLLRAVELDPVNPVPRMNLVDVLIKLGRPEAALKQAKTGIENRPDSPLASMSLARAHAAVADPYEGLVESVKTLEEVAMTGDEFGLLVRLLQLDLPDAAASWHDFFWKRSPDRVIFNFLRGRIAKSRGDIDQLRELMRGWARDFPEADSNRIEAAVLMMEANQETALNRRELYMQAFERYQAAEAVTPIDHNPVSDLVYFIVLTRELGDPALSKRLLVRMDKIPEYSVNETERAMKLLLSGDGPAFLAELEEQAQRGTLNIPFLREVGVTGGNQAFFNNISQHPRYQAAIQQQAKVNSDLKLRAQAEFPRILRAPKQVQ